MNRYCSGKFLSMLVLVMLILTTLPLGAVASTTSAPQANPRIEVEPELMAQIEADGTAGYLIYFREEAELSPAYEMNWSDRGWFVYETLTSVADRSQARVREYLSQQGADFQAFWIDNVIAVESSDYDTFNGLMGLPEIEALRAQRQAILYEPVESSPTGPSPEVVEPNIVHVGAPDVWAMGYTGRGIVVANIDTGVRYTHAALVNQYRGNLGGGVFDHNYNWWDPAAGGQDLAPNDWHSHGSHTMGTILGDDGGDNQVGMAPGARWIACQDFETFDNDNELLECGQFMAAPWDLTGDNPNPDLRPHIVNNSWGDCQQVYDSWYAGVIDAWYAAGIYPVFSNGNASNCDYPEPPGCNTVGNPARFGNVTGVGSTGRDGGQYAVHSNWGPTDDPDTINPLGYPTLKPQVMAPGVDIRSCYMDTNSAYGLGTGTSMSAPHVTGLIALMWSAAPCLVGDYANTETIIQQTATPIPYASDCGGEPPGNVPNFATGWGEINALAAVQAAINFCGEVGWLDGHVYDAVTLAPIENALVDAGGPSDRTDANGYYTITLLAGTYDVEVSHPLYTTAMTTGIVVTTDTVTTVDFTLQPRGRLFGYVTDADTSAPLDAVVTVDGGASVNTDAATGYYEMYLDEGTYSVTVAAQDYLKFEDSAIVNIVAGQDTQQDFALLALILFEPSPLHVTVTWQATYNMAATLTNRFASDYDFEFRELPGAIVPLALGTEGWNEYLPPGKAPAPTEVAHNSGPIVEGRGRQPFVHHGTTPQQFNIIVYSDEDYLHSPTAVEQALNSLGLTYTFYGNDASGTNLGLFRDAVNAGGWDLVILEQSHWTFFDASEYTAVEGHITAGGMAIVDSWAISSSLTHRYHALWAAMGVRYAAKIASPPQPLYWWNNAHQLFTYPESVPEFTSLNDLFLLTGARMTLLGDPSTGLGGFTTNPQPAQAGVILRDDNKTIYKGLTDIINDADLDSDGTRDVTEWWINALRLVLHGLLSDVPWFGQDPVSGAVPGQSSINPAMYFTATTDVGVTHPGDYYCDLVVYGDPFKEVRVTMTVEPAANMGQVHGYVISNYTSGSVEALIDIAGGDPITQTTSNLDTGYYSAWLVEGTYQLDFSAAGYLPISDTVDIVAGQTASLDVSMIPVFTIIYLPLTFKGYSP